MIPLQRAPEFPLHGETVPRQIPLLLSADASPFPEREIQNRGNPLLREPVKPDNSASKNPTVFGPDPDENSILHPVLNEIASR